MLPMVAARPKETPAMPLTLPMRAVLWLGLGPGLGLGLGLGLGVDLG